MVVKRFPSVVADDLKLAVIMKVLKVVIREAPKVVMKGGRVVIVVEVGSMILVVAAKKTGVLDMDPRVL
jgi:hypothetical protein